jgi:hypothetical protein
MAVPLRLAKTDAGQSSKNRLQADRGRRALLAFATAVTSFACNSLGADPATVASCNDYCAKYIAAACPSSRYSTVDDCRTNECARYSNAPADCQTAARALYDCEQTQADICGNTGCSNQLAAVTTCH